MSSSTQRDGLSRNSKSGGYIRRQPSSLPIDSDSSDSDDIDINISISIPTSKRRALETQADMSNIVSNSSSGDTGDTGGTCATTTREEDESTSSKDPVSTQTADECKQDDLRSLIRSKLSKASGYKPDIAY